MFQLFIALWGSAFAQDSMTEEEARPFHFDGIQMELIVDVERDIHKGPKELASVGWYGCGFFLTHPGYDLNLGFLYTGPTYTQKVEGEKFRLWISPQVVVAINQFAHGGTGLGPSLWIELGFMHDRVNLLAGTDLYFDPTGEEAMRLYGYYVLTDSPLEWLSYGVQAEVYEQVVIAGPQISFRRGKFTYRIEAYFDQHLALVRNNMQVSF
jgi:hypothetical protein